MQVSGSAMRVMQSSTRVGLLFALLVALSATLASADISLDNTCTHGSDYVQLVGFACIAKDEMARNANWTGQWSDQGKYMIDAFTMLNKNINRVGIDVGGTKFCSNFTVRTKKRLPWEFFALPPRSLNTCLHLARSPAWHSVSCGNYPHASGTPPFCLASRSSLAAWPHLGVARLHTCLPFLSPPFLPSPPPC